MKYYKEWVSSRTVFQGEGGNYTFFLTEYKEYDGESLSRIRINDELLKQQHCTEIIGKPEEGYEILRWENVALHKGDTIIV